MIPKYGTQSTVSSGIYYAFMVLIFFASNSHIAAVRIVLQSGTADPFWKSDI